METEKRAIILHGSGETSSSIWIPYVKEGLQGRGFFVTVPELPPAERPELNQWLSVVFEESYTDERVLIAHSGGSALALSVLERLNNVRIRQAILVAGFCTPNELDDFWFEGENPILQQDYNWDKIRNSVGQVICLNSDNDPYGCGIQKGQEIVDKIGSDKAQLILMKNQGHMGSDYFEQPYREFPYLLCLVG